MELKTITTLLIDGDGVLWRAGEPVPGINRFFNTLADHNIKWALLTNNATRAVDDYVTKLDKFNIKADAEQIFTSATTTVAYLRDKFPPETPLYVIGEEGLQRTLHEAGYVVNSGEELPGKAAAVVAGLDTGFNYQRMTVAARLIRDGAQFIATNPDRTFPTPQGLVPGAGSIIASLVAATDTQPTVIGKPESPIFTAAMQSLGGDKATTAMIGDRLETDILGAQRVGIGTIGVLTGVMTREQLADGSYQPDFLFDSIAELADALA